MNTKYDIEIWRRCKDWANKDEGKLFWRWLESEIDRLHTIAGNEIGANPLKSILDSQRNLASEHMARYISQFREMIQVLIDESEKQGIGQIDLTDL